MMKTTEHSAFAGSLWLVRGVIFILATASIGYGVMRGEHMEVLKKAVSICLQCIGIG